MGGVAAAAYTPTMRAGGDGAEPRRWVVYACRTPYTGEVAEIVWRRGEELEVLVDNIGEGEPAPHPLGPVVRPAVLAGSSRPAVVPLITPGHRFAVAAEARGHGLSSFPSLVDPTAIVARTATLGEGCVVNAAAVVGAASRIGAFVHLNRGASIGHDADLHDFTTLGPACVLAGHVTVGTGAFVGAGAVIAPKVTVGANSVVGTGAVVLRDVPDGATVLGNPARVVKPAGAGYGGASVPLA